MNVDALVARLDTIPSLAQVVEASPAGYVSPIDSSALLYSTLNSLVGGRMYPLFQGDDPVYPSIEYTLVESQPSVLDGFRISQSDTFNVDIRTTTYSTLVSLVNSVVDTLATTYVEVNAVEFNYEADKAIFVARIQVEAAYLPLDTQTLPAAFVYPMSRDAEPSTYDNYVKQLVQDRYGIVVVAPSAANMASLLGDIQESLLGWQQTPEYNEMEYASGSSIEGVSGLRVWREIYEDSSYIQQS